MSRLKLSRCALAVAAALALSACVTTAPQVESASPQAKETPQVADESKSSNKIAVATPASKNVSTKANTKTDKKSSKKAVAQPPVASAEQGGNAQGNPLLAGKPMSGRELLSELRILRGSFSTSNPLQALSSLFVPPSQPSAPAKGAARGAPSPEANALANMLSSPGGMGASAASLVGDIALDMLINELSYTAIDQFFGLMIDDKDVLAKVTVDVPDTSRLSPALRKQVLNLSAYLAAIKASGLMIDSSQGEFDAAKASYLRAVDIRQKAVKLLGEALVARDGLEKSERDDKKRGIGALNDPTHVALLEKFKDKRPEDLLNDFEAQNVALAFAQKSQPELFKDYRIEVEQVKTHYGAYAKTVVGTSSMLGFGALFLKKTKQLIEKEGAGGALVLLPLASQGLNEIVTLAPRIKKTFDGGDDMSEGSFKIMAEGNDKPLKAQLDAKKTLAALDSDAVSQFKTGLLNSQGDGLLYKLYKRSPKHAGILLDRLASKGARNALVKDYLRMEDATDFSFQNVYAGKLGLDQKHKQGLTADLLARPLVSAQPDAADQALLKLQEDFRGNLGSYSNSDLRQLMFAMQKEGQSNPALNLGKTEIRIDSLGVAGLAEYDEIAGSSLAQAVTRTHAKEKPGKRKVLSSL